MYKYLVIRTMCIIHSYHIFYDIKYKCVFLLINILTYAKPFYKILLFIDKNKYLSKYN